MKQQLKRFFFPIRKLAAQFVRVELSTPKDPIIYNAAHLVASEKIEGDYLEFGVFAGASFVKAYHTIKSVFELFQTTHAGRTREDVAEIANVWDGMRFFAFDSFQGLPDLTGVDLQSREFEKGKYASSEDAFLQSVARAGMPLSKVVTVPGWFDDTCNDATVRKHCMKKAAIIHIDCDLYESAKTALEFVKPLITNGTIIIFDDWFCFRGNPNLGEQRAFYEWKVTMPEWFFTEYHKDGPWRNSFIIGKRVSTE